MCPKIIYIIIIMNKLEIDLTRNLGNDTNIENEFINNYSSPKYTQYLNMIENFFNEINKIHLN